MAAHLAILTVDDPATDDLTVSGMGRLPTSARAVPEAGLGHVLRQVADKTALCGFELHAADRVHPRSKTCSAWGT